MNAEDLVRKAASMRNLDPTTPYEQLIDGIAGDAPTLVRETAKTIVRHHGGLFAAVMHINQERPQ